uniref:pectinesterase n=1 Tax=Cannabis sativa TaxID=3483 RepID=A0A803PW85_CANSA
MRNITWAPAAMIAADKASFYRCGFISLQDTLSDAHGRHYFESCHIQGAIDFIWGDAQSFYQSCSLEVTGSRIGLSYITAQGRNSESDMGGFVFNGCKIFGNGEALLGRAYRAYATVLYYNTYMDNIISPQGWDAWFNTGHESLITFAEVGCEGPGAHMSKRVTWEKKLTNVELQKLINVNNFINQDGCEKVSIKREKPFIFLEGESSRNTIIAWGDSGDIVKSPTFSCHADNIVASKIQFKNSYNVNHKKEAITWAPAALVEGDKVSFYGCSFISVQDTLFDALGRHYFEKCYIQGDIDFIFGNAQSYYEKCNLFVSISGSGSNGVGYITAQGRESSNETSGYVFHSNTIKGTGPTLLGRAYRPHSRVLFYKTYMSDIVSPEGWNAWESKGHDGTTTSSPAHYSTTKEVTMKTITVDKSGKGDFTTVQQAIDSVPEDNNAWIRIHIKAGTYNEKVSIERRKQFIFLEGERRSTTMIAWGDGGDVVKSPTFSSHADNFVATRITFKNYYNHPVMTNNGDYYKDRDGKKILWAPAALVEGDKASFYDCAFISVQDTLFDALGRHYFQNCYIEGAIDFIFGDAQSFYQKCNLFADTALLGPGQSYGYIAAQGRKNQSESSGYVFFGNTIKGSGPTLLGRAYRPYSRVLFYKTYMSDVVLPPGWDAWNYVSSEEKVNIPREKPYIYLEGINGRDETVITFNDHEKTDESATFSSFPDNIVAKGISFENTLINVTVGKMMENVKYIGYITAQGRASENDPGGFVFEGGSVVGSGQVYLGRAYGAFSRVIFHATNFASNIIVPQGWYAWFNKGHE